MSALDSNRLSFLSEGVMWGFLAVSVCVDMREGDDQFAPDRVRREWDGEGKLRVTFLIRTRFSPDVSS